MMVKAYEFEAFRIEAVTKVYAKSPVSVCAEELSDADWDGTPFSGDTLARIRHRRY